MRLSDTVKVPAGWRRPLRFIALVAALCAATYVVQVSGARYIPAPLAASVAGSSAAGQPPSDLRAWQGSGAGIAFAGRDGSATASLAPRDPARGGAGVAMLHTAFAIPDGTAALRLRFRAAADALVAGEEPWQAGRIQIVSFDGKGQRVWYWPNDVYRLSGHRPYESVSVIVPVNVQLKAALLIIYNGAEAGVLRVGPLEVSYLAERPLFAGLRYGLVLAWGLTGLWIAGTVLRRAASVPIAALLLGTVLFALAAALTPQPAFRALTAPLQAWTVSLAELILQPGPDAAPSLAEPGFGAGMGRTPGGRSEAVPDPDPPPDSGTTVVLPQAPPNAVLSFKQLSHLAMFFLIGLAGFLAFPHASWLGRLACLASLAAATECLQWFVVTRSSQIADLVVDLAGLGLAGAVVFAATWMAARLRRRSRNAPLSHGPRRDRS